MACAFSLLAAALAVNLTDTLWAVSGPISSMVEFVLRFLVWLYTFSLCALSLYLAITALRRGHKEAKQAETRWSLLALAIAVLATVLSLYSYWIP
jgi:hypothetical protein